MLDKYDQKDRFFFFFWCFLTPENIINVVTRYLHATALMNQLMFVSCYIYAEQHY